jgi:hypothetical protein
VGEAAADDEHELAVGRGEVHLLVERDDPRPVVLDVPLRQQRGQRVAREAIQVDDDHRVHLARLDVGQERPNTGRA